MLATLGLRPLRLPVEMIRSGWICSTVSPAARRRSAVCREDLVAGNAVHGERVEW
jgi:hypothetical protein